MRLLPRRENASHLRPFRAASAIVLALVAVPAARAGDWSRFRGPDGMGVSAEKGLPTTWSSTQNVVWKTELPGAGASCPSIFGDRIFVACYSGFGGRGAEGAAAEKLERHLVCLDRAGGKIRWSIKVPTRLPEQEKIREEHGYASSTPVIEPGRVYVFFGKSGLFAFDHDGKQLWHADVGDGLSGWGSSNSPVIAGDLVIINASVESESLIAFDKKTGVEKWRAGSIKESWNTPILVKPAGGKEELVVAIGGKILGFDPGTGKELWSCDTDIRWYMVPGLVAADGVIYCIGGRTGGALAVRAGGKGDVTATHRLWTGKKGSNVTSPLFHEGRLYWMHENIGVAYCADAKTGEILYEARVDGCTQVYASPVLVEGKIFQVARDGRTHVIAAKPTYERVAVNELGERGTFNSGLAVAGGKFYLRSNKYLYCLGK